MNPFKMTSPVIPEPTREWLASGAPIRPIAARLVTQEEEEAWIRSEKLEKLQGLEINEESASIGNGSFRLACSHQDHQPAFGPEFSGNRGRKFLGLFRHGDNAEWIRTIDLIHQ
jgi:hypothetical protein